MTLSFMYSIAEIFGRDYFRTKPDYDLSYGFYFLTVLHAKCTCSHAVRMYSIQSTSLITTIRE